MKPDNETHAAREPRVGHPCSKDSCSLVIQTLITWSSGNWD